VDPSDPNTVYAGSRGIFRSTDGGVTWEDRSGPFRDDSLFSEVKTIIVDPWRSDSVLAFAHHSSANVARSDDGGATWTQIAPSACVMSLAAFPDPPLTLLAGGCREELFISHDRGNSWELLSTMGPTEATHLAPLNRDTGVIFAASPGRARLSRSTDAGSSWERISGMGFVRLVDVEPNTEAVYVLSVETMFRSMDRGDSWDEWPIPVSPSCFGFHPSRPAELYVGDGSSQASHETTVGGVYRSTDGGRGWERIGPRERPTPVEALAIASNGTVLVGAMAPFGVFRSADHGLTWTASRAGMGPAVSGVLVVDPHNPDVLFSPAPDHIRPPGRSRPGLFRSTDHGSSWSLLDVETDHWGPLAANPHRPGDVLSGGPILQRSTDGGDTWTELEKPLPDQPAEAISFDAVDETVYAISGDAFRSEDQGQSWFRLADAPQGCLQPPFLATSKVNGGALYMAVPSRLWRSGDYGETWDIAFAYDRGGMEIWGLAESPHQPQVILAAARACILRSTDGGTTWEGIDDGLDITCEGEHFVACDGPYAVVFNPARPGTAYAGSDTGVYRTTDNGATWRAFSNGLPEGGVHGLTVDPDGGLLWAAHVRGGIYTHSLKRTRRAAGRLP
jgi:photosystem II stability/assembly factor-like uncharacterized protein